MPRTSRACRSIVPLGGGRPSGHPPQSGHEARAGCREGLVVTHEIAPSEGSVEHVEGPGHGDCGDTVVDAVRGGGTDRGAWKLLDQVRRGLTAERRRAELVVS